MSQIKKRKEPLEFSSSIFSALLGQTSKSGIVLESWQCAHFNSFPDIAIGPRFDGNIEENPDSTEWINFDFTVRIPKNFLMIYKRGINIIILFILVTVNAEL